MTLVRLVRLVSALLVAAAVASAVKVGRSTASADAWNVEITLGTLQITLLVAGLLVLVLGRRIASKRVDAGPGPGD